MALVVEIRDDGNFIQGTVELRNVHERAAFDAQLPEGWYSVLVTGESDDEDTVYSTG